MIEILRTTCREQRTVFVERVGSSRRTAFSMSMFAAQSASFILDI